MPALDGMRVLDFTQYEAGPSCCQYLAWLGADVVKVEPPGGEPGRRTGAGSGVAQYFENYNGNKRSVVVDVRTEAGRDLVRRMAKRLRRVRREPGPAGDGEARPRPGQPAGRPPRADLRPHQGLRAVRAVRRVPQLRHARPGRRRAVRPHRRARRPADPPRRHVRRHRHRRPHGDGDPRRLRPAPAHGRGPGHRDEHARGHDDVHPHHRHQRLVARRRRRRRGSATPSAARRRTCTRARPFGPNDYVFVMVGTPQDVGGAVQGDRSPRPARRRALPPRRRAATSTATSCTASSPTWCAARRPSTRR